MKNEQLLNTLKLFEEVLKFYSDSNSYEKKNNKRLIDLDSGELARNVLNQYNQILTSNEIIDDEYEKYMNNISINEDVDVDKIIEKIKKSVDL